MDKLARISTLLRYHILLSSTKAGSGHPTSSLSAAEIMSTLFFGGFFRFKVNDPRFPNNDRFILSKGHASPLFYALWAAAGVLTEKELLSYREMGGVLEGHPTKRFGYTEVATGSLGQGLSVGVGMAINAKYLDKLPYRTYVLLGDSEMSEGANWEAIQLASYYKLDNLVGIIDVNRLGQSSETMLGYDLNAYDKRMQSFGWDSFVVHDGHSLSELSKAFEWARAESGKPKMIIAKTIKGKGVKLLEDKENWHGKVLDEKQMSKAIKDLGVIDQTLVGDFAFPDNLYPPSLKRGKVDEIDSSYLKKLATRKAYGHALVEAFKKYPEMVVLDAEVSNSTYAQTFKEKYPKNFFEMYIAEQNMVGVALGLSERGKIPFVSTFASFFTRAVDQIRVSQYSKANINFVGSHAGVSIGEDGPTQMGLEDMAIFRSILGSVVLYPADHVSSEKLVMKMIEHPGICYMRTTRMDTEPLYLPDEEFEIGGSKILKSSKKDKLTIAAAGITIYEALSAYKILKKEGIAVRVIDMYSVKPIDKENLEKCAKETGLIISVEDHFAEGGLGDAILESLSEYPVPVYKMAVSKMPMSGSPAELMEYEEIDAKAIVAKIKKVLSLD